MPRTDLSWKTIRPVEGFYTSEIVSSGHKPVRTFLPSGYEPNYAYPLLVFFHGHGSNEEHILQLAPRLSRRNFICIGLRGQHMLRNRSDGRQHCTWEPDGQFDAVVEDYIFHAIEQTRRNYHIHSERIYLAGICEGATLAYRFGLSFPERFAGIIALNGSLPHHGAPLLRLPTIRNLRVLIGHGIANAVVPMAEARSAHRLLYTAGLDVRLHTYPSTHRLHADMLRDVNRWVIEACNV